MAEESTCDGDLVGVTAAAAKKRERRPPILASMKTFALPRKNRGDLQGAAMEARREMRFMMASNIAEVLDVGLNRDRAKPAKNRGQESP
jgi:hypothetical protein